MFDLTGIFVVLDVFELQGKDGVLTILNLTFSQC